jgi:hypothetical protein
MINEQHVARAKNRVRNPVRVAKRWRSQFEPRFDHPRVRAHSNRRLYVAECLPGELPDRDSLLRQREDRAGRGDAAQDMLAKRDQPHCSLGSDRA